MNVLSLALAIGLGMMFATIFNAILKTAITKYLQYRYRDEIKAFRKEYNDLTKSMTTEDDLTKLPTVGGGKKEYFN